MLIAIVGAGVVGSHIALTLKNKKNEIFLLEKEHWLWFHTSTRNSGVIHAGIYYPYHSLKREFCVKGARQTYDFLKKYGVEHRKSGKIIVAKDDAEKEKLKQLYENGKKNGVNGLKLIGKSEIEKLEPNCKAEYALYSPETGVVNCSDYYRKIEALMQEKGINIVNNCKVQDIDVEKAIVKTDRGELNYDILVNAAGLWADEVAKMCGIEGFKIVPYKGDYYALNEDTVNSMIYPVPLDKKGALGVHFTKTAYNEIWIGPTSKEHNKKDDYDVYEKKDIFLKACEIYLKNFNPDRITEGFSGNRPKLFFQGKFIYDFIIFRRKNVIHLLGIDSPGLTAAPAIANYVAVLI